MRGDIFCHCSSFQLFELNDRGRQYFALHKFFLIFSFIFPFFVSVFLGPFFHDCTCESSSIVNLYETAAYAVFSSFWLFHIVIGFNIAFLRQVLLCVYCVDYDRARNIFL